MACASTSQPERKPESAPAEVPHSRVAAFIVERNYFTLGCDKWNSRKVKLLCAKLGDTPIVFAARLRVRPSDLERRMKTDEWSKQDGLILTILEREIDSLRGGVVPKGRLVENNPSATIP